MDKLFHEFEIGHKKYVSSLTDKCKISQLNSDLDKHTRNHAEFKTRVAEWINSDDAVSQISDEIVFSESITANLKDASIKRKLAMLNVKKLEETQNLERKQQELAFQKQHLDAQTELDRAILNEQLFQNAIESDIQAPLHNAPNPSISTAPFAGTSSENTTQEIITANNHEQSPAPIDEPAPKNHRLDRDSEEPKSRQEENMDMLKNLAGIIQEGFHLPKPELLMFSGQSVDYCKFINNFVTNIENRVSDSRLRLSYLIQYCTGEAKRSIEDCVLLEPTEGYLRAKQILQENFGRPHIITRTYIERLVNGPRLASGDSRGLVNLAREMEKCEITLSKLGFNSDINNTDNLKRIVSRLPVHVQGRWADKADMLLQEEMREPDFSDLSKFIKKRARVASSVYGLELSKDANPARFSRFGHSQYTKSKPGLRKPAYGKSTVYSTSGKTLRKCWCCSGQCPSLAQCSKFRGFSVEKRLEYVKANRRCQNCLAYNHFARNCYREKGCKIAGCPHKHHILLHQLPKSGQNQNPSSAKPTGGCNATSSAGKGKVCLRILPVRVENGTKSIDTYALLDNGSDVSLCDERLVSMLDLKGKSRTFTINSVNSSKVVNGQEVGLQVRSLNSSDGVNIEQAWSVSRLPISLRGLPNNGDISTWPHLAGIEIPRIASNDVMLLIGSDTPEAFWPLEERRGRRGEPYAIRSILGWTIQGPIAKQMDSDVAQVNFQQSGGDILQEQIHSLWNAEFNDGPSAGKSLSVEDKRALRIMEESVTREGGHYMVDLPWRDRDSSLPNNKPLADYRLKYLATKLKKDQELHKRYKQQIDEYISKDYASKSVPSPTGDRVWYLPHHGVTNIHKPDKVRVVFDCAAKYKGASLNASLLQGPDLANNLIGVLIRFRQEHIALVSDIEAMFHQVRVPPKDRNSLRFLWWRDGDPNQKIEEYCMNVHLFGATSSPSCTMFCLRQCAKDNETKYNQETIRTIERNFYIDDLLKSVPTAKQGVNLAKELTDVLRQGGFKLRKWASNSKEVLASIPGSDRAPTLASLDFDNNSQTERALGVSWEIKNDTFSFQIKQDQKPFTRRGLLSIVASLFDPLGLVAPVTLSAKMLFQRLCKEKMGWDEPMSKLDIDNFCAWLNSLNSLTKLKIPRCFKPSNFGSLLETELHLFSDASQFGYGACCYLRLRDTSGTVHVSLVMGKSRLAPIKTVTIPRLELSAAVLACRLFESVSSEIELKVKRVVFWTDSTIVLGYIANTTKRFKTFVANRISVIHESSTPSQWRHVPGKENPADLASRGIKATDTDQLHFWLNGPNFLWDSEAAWPTIKASSEVDEEDTEVRRERAVNATGLEMSALESMFARFSDWYKLSRAVAWLLRFKTYCVHKFLHRNDSVNTDRLSTLEIDKAKTATISYVQHRTFDNEVKGLRKGCNVSKSSKLFKLNPVFDGQLLRVGGRIKNAKLPEDSRHQIILPQRHVVTSMVIRDFHNSNGHVGPRHTLSGLRHKYWIVNGIQACKSLISKCFPCRRRRQLPMQQQMADLPAERLTPDLPPFSNVGVDYFGPFLVQSRRTRVKRYGCIFTCMSSRAVHIEVTHSLDTDSFLCAVSRFMSRRGKPKKFFSDNGTNFVAGEKELRQSLMQFNQNRLNRSLNQKGIEWHFMPPSASHMGGVWERMIRSVRDILKAIVKQQVLNDEALVTFMTEVEGILNSRPITAVSDDVRDPQALTPNHLLLLSPQGSFPPGVFTKDDCMGVRRWRQIHYLANVFWKRWIKEYLPSLQIREKWQRPHRCVKPNDVVLVVDENIPRAQWPLGLVVEVNKGRDNLVRSCKVRVGTTVYVRPIHKLCLLEQAE